VSKEIDEVKALILDECENITEDEAHVISRNIVFWHDKQIKDLLTSTESEQTKCTGKCTKCKLTADECNEEDWPEYDLRSIDSDQASGDSVICPQQFLTVGIGWCKNECGRHLGIKDDKVMCRKGECNCYDCIGDREAEGVVFRTMCTCTTCGNKRCPKATDHNLECSGSNEPNQEGSIY
jgi:hypothetical protein